MKSTLQTTVGLKLAKIVRALFGEPTIPIFRVNESLNPIESIIIIGYLLGDRTQICSEAVRSNIGG
jgi:hypothetical protein